MFVSEMLAEYAASQVVGLTAADNVFVEHLDEDVTNRVQVVFTTYGSYAGLVRGVDPHHCYDTYMVQAMVRGVPVTKTSGDANSGRQEAQSLYNVLHMLDYSNVVTEPPTGVDMSPLWQCMADGAPFRAGFDDNNRPMWVVNFKVQVRSSGGLRSE